LAVHPSRHKAWLPKECGRLAPSNIICYGLIKLSNARKIAKSEFMKLLAYPKGVRYQSCYVLYTLPTIGRHGFSRADDLKGQMVLML